MKIRTRVFGFLFSPPKIGTQTYGCFPGRKKLLGSLPVSLGEPVFAIKNPRKLAKRPHPRKRIKKKKLRFQKSPCSLKKTNEVILGSHLSFFGGRRKNMIEPYKLTFGAIRIHGDLAFSRPVIFATSFWKGPKLGWLSLS